jgi:type 1 fimbriae regulatory protein FimE
MPPAKRRLPLSTKSTKRPSAPPTKPRNADVRSREYLTPAEAKELREAAKNTGRHGFRDWLLVMMMYRHGLRVGEIIDLKWEQVDLSAGKLHVNRLKNGDASVHFIEGDELRALRKLQRDYPGLPFLFVSERGGPLSARTVHAIFARAGVEAGIKFPVHPHMARHAKGYQLASKGIDTRAIQAYLGHKNIQHTVLYTKPGSSRFKGFAKD